MKDTTSVQLLLGTGARLHGICGLQSVKLVVFGLDLVKLFYIYKKSSINNNYSDTININFYVDLVKSNIDRRKAEIVLFL